MFRLGSILLAVMLFVAGGSQVLFGQTYPSRPIHVIIPMPPGDSLDITGRVMVEGLADILKATIVPMNKIGAGGVVGTDFVAKSKNDGYTLLMVNSASLTSGIILHPEEVRYDPFKDLEPLGMTTVTPTVVTMKSDAPYKSLKDLAEFSRKNPGKLRCATPGLGTLADFNLALFKTATGADVVTVPFKGAVPAITALVGGHVEMGTCAITPMIQYLRRGEFRGLVVSKKLPEFPDIPTLRELGGEQDLFGVWFAFFAPAGVPAEVKEKLIPAIEKVAKNPEVVARMARMGLIQDYVPPDKLLQEWRKEYKLGEQIAKKEGLIR
ncbi:MAG: tripartite tricarboxylate transporter substrate binding protein [Deltaproteobacteria bacterium]|nr:tripartite tricarboxylate transporter substrate binding protein [Deltaproteobacteria bacterium]